MKETKPEAKSDFVDMSASAGAMIKTHEGEHHGDFGDVPIKLTRSAMIFTLCAALNSCNLGYDVGSSTAAGMLIQEELELTRIQREVWTGSLNFWAIFGALGAQMITDRMGRRKTFVVSAFIFVLGIVITIATANFAVIMLGRFFIGVGLGIGLAVDPLYIAEYDCRFSAMDSGLSLMERSLLTLAFHLFLQSYACQVPWKLGQLVRDRHQRWFGVWICLKFDFRWFGR